MRAKSEQEILFHVKQHYGWYGGVGDPPDDTVLLAAIRGTLDAIAGPDNRTSPTTPEATE